ncbi:hypothetical protein [Photobacterium kishitanii]|uniref:Uncharacterized protein n=1 Tax=Photobacterium kishitanii TaxID=318456 RepID=A0A2T3KLK2_9GAMM|nr:hypothetical protein [Photobacterium kishitanii]PSV00594.1 hypothetical protein C9J27_05515 [Photobacterium kishitanii]
MDNSTTTDPDIEQGNSTLSRINNQHKQIIKEFKFNADSERDSHYRLHNSVISCLMQMNPTSWRMFEAVTSGLDIYPFELIEDSDFLSQFTQGKASIPEHFRTVTVHASDYSKRWGLTRSNGHRQFTLDALTLFNETLSTISFDERSNSADIKLSRPVSDVTFHATVQNKETGATTLDFHDSMIRKNTKDKRDNTVWQCSSATFVIHEKLALNMLLLQKMFTRIEKSATAPLSKAGAKLYAFMCMISGSRCAVNDAWCMALDLTKCNSLCGTKYNSIVDFARNFNLPSELTSKSDFDVTAIKDEESKIGRKYMKIKIFFSRKTCKKGIEELAKKGKITRRLVPRPRVLVGSHEEGVWARKNIKILLEFESKLINVKRILPKADRERLSRYRKIIGEA